MRLDTTLAVVILAARLGAGQEGKPAQSADRPVRTTTTRAMVQHVSFSPDSATVVAWEWSGYARWNPETNKTVDRQPVIAKACAGTKGTPVLPRSEDGRTIGAHCGGKVVFFDVATGNPLGELKGDPKQTPTIYTLSADGALIAVVTAGATSTIQVIDAKSGERRAQIQNEQEVQQLSFAPSAQVLATGAVDGVRIWSLPAGQLLRTIPGGTFHALSADGTTLALERGRDVAVVDLASGEVKHTLNANVSQVRFSGDGTRLAGWNNQTLTVWHVATGKVLLTLKSSQLVTAALDRDGKQLLAVALDLAGGGAQTTIGVWRVGR